MKQPIPVTKTISGYYFAFSLLFGFYLMSHGHISHGAGFAGGIMITLGFLQAVFVLGNETVSNIINESNTKILMLSGIIGILLISAVGLFYGAGFMANVMPLGKKFGLISSGLTPFYNIMFCLSVTGSLLLIILSLIRADKE
jgi:multisubunit Na+/H+ antiporter MnhB subunit